MSRRPLSAAYMTEVISYGGLPLRRGDAYRICLAITDSLSPLSQSWDVLECDTACMAPQCVRYRLHRRRQSSQADGR
jgi:hypothetical protein